MHLARAIVLFVLPACGFRAAIPAGSDGNVIDGAIEDAPDHPADASLDAEIDAPPSPLCVASDLTMRACYTFDGNTLDGSAYGHDATANQTTFGPGHTGQGLVIGAGDLITVGSSSDLDLSQVTIKMWIRPTSIPMGGARAGLIDSGNRFRMFLHSGGLVRCATTNGPSLFTTATHAVPVNLWTHLVCTYDGITMRIYVNGDLAAMTGQSSTIPMGAGMVIGHNNPSGENFQGTLDELQVFGAVVPP